jgi:hypothetical protein
MGQLRGDFMVGLYLSPEVPGSGGSGGSEDIVPISDDSVVASGARLGRSPSTTPSQGGSKIRSFTQQLGEAHEEKWSRTPNTTGTGAIHVKSFHCKLTGDSLKYLDEQINEWLDGHPQYEVKSVTTSIGLWTGKLKEPNLIVNVWV